MLTFAEESYMKLYELLEKADILTCSQARIFALIWLFPASLLTADV